MQVEPQLLPWQETPYDDLQQLRSAGRLGHAWLISGLKGIGKLSFSRYLAAALFCEDLARQPCGQCTACHLFEVGSHPDWRLIQPEKSIIKIEQIREAIDFAFTTSQRGGYKVLCIEPAEGMNLNAANALLKLLEEPPKDTLLLLLSHQPGLLLPTLRSRCQHLKLPIPEETQAIAWLQKHGLAGEAATLIRKARGAPLHALGMTETGLLSEHEAILSLVTELLNGHATPIQAAKKCEKFAVDTTIDYLMDILAEMTTSLQTGQELRDKELGDLLKRFDSGKNSRRIIFVLHRLYLNLGKIRKTAVSGNNPNSQLILEQIFTDWSKLRQLS